MNSCLLRHKRLDPLPFGQIVSSLSNTFPADLTWVTPVFLIWGRFDTMTGSTILERNLGIFIIKMAATDVLLVLLFRLVVGLSNCFQRPSGQRPMIMSLGNLTINCKVSDSFASAYWSGDVRLGHCGCG